MSTHPAQESKPARISREGRDTLWLLMVITLCALPHATRLPLWCSAGTGLAIAWRAWIAYKDGALPPRWVLLLAMVVAAALTLATHQSLLGRQAGITLVTLLTALKTLELRARRDAFVVTSLGFFLILTQFLHDQSIGLAALMLVATLGLLSSLVLAQRPHGRPTISSAVAAAARSMIMGAPLMVALYVLFPRVGPLWSAPSDSGPRTGLSDRIELGEISELALDDSVAMRIRFKGPTPSYHEMYFRGPILDLFDGRHWSSSSSLRLQEPSANQSQVSSTRQAMGRQIDYQITIEPNRLRTLPLLEGTLAAQISSNESESALHRNGLSWHTQRTLTNRTQLEASAWMGARDDGTPSPTDLALPAGHNPRTLAWAIEWRHHPDRKNASADALVSELLRHIRLGGFKYTLAPGDDATSRASRRDRPQGASLAEHPIDRFWMERKTGFCEHYATAFVVILRAMNVPARVVTGFQGAEINPVDGLHVVRNSDAHAWAEYWSPDQVWTRIDPTAAVAPNRIDRPRPPIRYPEQLPRALQQLNPALWGNLRSYADAANHRWNIWVLQYSNQSQMRLLRQWGFESPDWITLVRLSGGVVSMLALCALLWLWWQRPSRPSSPWHATMMKLHKTLEKAGLTAPAGCPAPAPALSWAASIEHQRQTPRQANIAHQLTTLLQAIDAMRYAPSQEDTPKKRRELLKKAMALAAQWSREAITSAHLSGPPS